MNQDIIATLKEMVAKLEADTQHEWLHTEYDSFVAKLKELKEFAVIEIVKANAPKPAWHGVTDFIEEVKAEVVHVVEEVEAEVTQVVEEVKAKVKKTKAVEAPVTEAPATDAPVENNKE